MRTLDLGLSEVGSRSAEQWKRLSDIAVAPNPFADPRFLLTSAHTHDHARRGRVLLVEDGSETIGALSYTPAVRRVGPLTLRSVSTSESFSAFEGERHHPLVAPTRAAEVFGAFIDAARARNAHLLDLSRVPQEGGLRETLVAVAQSRGLPVSLEVEQEFVFIHRKSVPPSADADDPLFLLEHLSAPARKKIRRLVRSFEREHGPLSLLDETADPEAIDRFLALQNAGWKGNADRDGKAFQRTGLDSWFRAVTGEFRQDGRLSVLSLRANGRVASMTVVLYAGFRAFGFHDAYAEGFARFSPGTLGRLARMQALFRTDHLELFDPSMDDEWYPQALHHFPDRALYATCTVGVRNIGIPIVRHLPRLRTLRHRISSARRAVSSRR